MPPGPCGTSRFVPRGDHREVVSGSLTTLTTVNGILCQGSVYLSGAGFVAEGIGVADGFKVFGVTFELCGK